MPESISIYRNASRSGLNLDRHSAAAHLATNLFPSDRPLHGNRMVQVDRPRSCVRVEFEGCILREPECDATRTRVYVPCASRVAVCLDVSAPSLRLQRAANISELQSALTCFRSHRALGHLFQPQVSAASLAVKASRNTPGGDGAAAGTSEDGAFHVVDFDA